MKILTILGARPQFIKAEPLSKLLRQTHQEIILHTGQHYDDLMSGLFFRELALPQPNYNLGVGSGSHARQTAAMLTGIEDVALNERPDLMLVYGDTNSTLAGALVASKLHVPLAHVEAGLRSFDKTMPEEVNRVVTDHLSSALFCPTSTAVKNLNREGIDGGVYLVGDVMLDAMLINLARTYESEQRLFGKGLTPGSFCLVTLHRPSNVDDPARLSSILRGLEISATRVIFPMHPRTRVVLERMRWSPPESIELWDPVGYLEMLALERTASVIVTDSGGVQKEAYLLGIPCITIRESTEWPETVEAGWNTLVPPDADLVASALRTFRPTQNRPPVFGNGSTARRIVELFSTITIELQKRKSPSNGSPKS